MATPPKDPKDYLKTGRPSSYRPEFAEMLIEYFSRPAWDVTDVDGNTVEGYFPTIAGFCWEIGICLATFHNWTTAKDLDGSPMFPEFLDAYKAAKARQEQLFTVGYMRGKYFNPAIGALIAKNLMNWRDKQEIESQVTQTIEGTISVGTSLAETLAKAKAKAGVE